MRKCYGWGGTPSSRVDRMVPWLDGVDLIDTSGFTDPDLITVANKYNELITALRR